jgi:hypothetical protein
VQCTIHAILGVYVQVGNHVETLSKTLINSLTPMATKKMTITILPEHQQKAKEISKELLGKENISGLFAFWINEYLKKKTKK